MILGVEAHCTGSLVLEVVFSSPDNFRSEELIFDIAPFQRGYHALLERTAFAHFNVVPHYAYLKLKMFGPRGVIMISGNTERSLRTEEYTVALAVEAQNGLFKTSSSSVFKTADTERIRRTPQRGSSVSRPICDPIQKELKGPTKDRPAY